MEEIKAYIIMMIGALLTLLSPIENFMYAMLLLLGLNFVYGLIAAIVSGEGWDTKKALKFIWFSALFFITVCCVFLIGHFMNEEQQAIAVVKILCLAATYIFGTNIFRNWRNIITPRSTWYKFVDLCYYVLSIQFIEKFPWVKKWQDREKTTGRTILDKDDN